jgi:hypothetical protein
MEITLTDGEIREIKNFYGNLTDEEVKLVVKDILDRYLNAEYFEPEFFEE